MKALPYFSMEQQMSFVLPSDYVKKTDAVDTHSTIPMSWVAINKKTYPWTGNDLQQGFEQAFMPS